MKVQATFPVLSARVGKGTCVSIDAQGPWGEHEIRQLIAMLTVQLEAIKGGTDDDTVSERTPAPRRLRSVQPEPEAASG